MLKKILSLIVLISSFCILSGAAAAHTSSDAKMKLVAGRTYEITNKDTRNSHMLSSAVSYVQATAKYDYISKNAAKSIESYGVSSGSIFINAGSTMIVTPNSDMEVTYPKDISVKETSGSALYRSTAEASKTLEISNRSADTAYSVSIDDIGAARYDCVYKDILGRVTGYASEAISGSITLEPSGSVTITAGNDSAIKLIMPNEWIKTDVSVKSVNTPALSYYTLQAGKTVSFRNKNQDTACGFSTNCPNSVTPVRFDYVVKDGSGMVTEYVSASASGNVAIPAGGTALITAGKSYEVKLWYPYDWHTGYLTIANESQPAVYTRTIAAGKSLEIANKNSVISFKLTTNSSPLPTTPKYDYLFKDSEGKATGFGSETAYEEISVYASGTTVISAKNGYDLKIWFPNEWAQNWLTFKDSDNAALYVYTLSAGKTVQIKNNDASGDYSLSISGSAKDAQYNYVNKDEYGAIKTYGTELAGEGIYVARGGVTTITAANGYALKLIMPSEYRSKALTLTESAKPALNFYTVSADKTVQISNKNSDLDIYVTVDNEKKYDLVFKDSHSSVISYESESDRQKITIAKGGTAVLTADKSSGVKICYPGEWQDKDLAITDLASPALSYYTLNPSKTAVFRNSDRNTMYTVATNSANTSGAPKYDYVKKDSDNAILSFGSEETFESFVIEMGGSTAITAKTGYPLKIWYPLEWRAVSVAESGQPALYTYSLAPESSAIIRNNGSVTLSVRTNSTKEHQGPQISYVLSDHTSRPVAFETEVYRDRLDIGSKGSAVITADKGSDLKLLIPYEAVSGIEITASADPAVYSRTVRAGSGVKLVNIKQDISYSIKTNAGGQISYDYLYRNSDNAVAGYGVVSNAPEISVEAGGSAQIYVCPGADMKLLFPYAWMKNGLSVSDQSSLAVYSYTIPAGKTVEIVNSDKDYAYTVSTNCSNAVNSPKFDYLFKDMDNEIIDYSAESAASTINVLCGGKTVVTAKKGYDLKIWFPNELNTSKLTVNEVSDPALFTRTVASGKSVEISNTSTKAFALRNNSGSSITAPKYTYKVKDSAGKILSTNEMKDGVLTVQANGYIQLTAVNGYDLKIWMPYEWLSEGFNVK